MLLCYHFNKAIASMDSLLSFFDTHIHVLAHFLLMIGVSTGVKTMFSNNIDESLAPQSR